MAGGRRFKPRRPDATTHLTAFEEMVFTQAYPKNTDTNDRRDMLHAPVIVHVIEHLPLALSGESPSLDPFH